MFFSFSYIKEAIALFLKYPGAIRVVIGEFSALSPYVESRVKLDYRELVEVKHTRGFDIYLSPPNTDSRTSAFIATLGYWELVPTELFCKVLKEGMTVIDVGANIGWFTLLSAKLVGKKGMVVAFEPDVSSYSLLKRSVERNMFEQVHLESKCVSDSNGSLTLYLDSDSLRHSITRQTDRSITVPCISLDYVAASYKIERVNLLKIDVEEAEAQVLAGARDLLSESRIDNIVIEWNPEGWANKRDLLDFVRSRYDAFRIVSNSPFLIKPIENFGGLTPLVNVFFQRKDLRR